MLTRMSISAHSAGRAVDGILHGAMVAHVEIDRVDGRRSALHGARSDLGKFAGPAGREQKPCSLGGKSERSGCADPGAGPGHEDDLSLKTHDNILTNRRKDIFVMATTSVGDTIAIVDCDYFCRSPAPLSHAVLAHCPVFAAKAGSLSFGEDFRQIVSQAQTRLTARRSFAQQPQILGA